MVVGQKHEEINLVIESSSDCKLINIGNLVMNNPIEIYQEKQQIKYLYLQADVESLLLKLKAEITKDNKTIRLVDAQKAST